MRETRIEMEIASLEGRLQRSLAIGSLAGARFSECIARHHLPEETAHGSGEKFLARLHDPVLDRTIEHEFAAVPLGDDLAERSRFERPTSLDYR